MQKTMSEQIFERFCEDRGIVCTRVPEGEGRTPDYELDLDSVRVVVEVKEIAPSAEELESERLARVRGYGNAISSTPGDKVRKKIGDCSSQIKARTGGTLPSMLVVFDRGRVVGHADADNIRVAMYGMEQVYIALPPIGEGEPYATGMGHGPRRKMTPEHNTSISAVGTLFMTGPLDVHLHVYHNCFARVPLDTRLLARHHIPQFQIGEPRTRSASAWHEVGLEHEP